MDIMDRGTKRILQCSNFPIRIFPMAITGESLDQDTSSETHQEETGKMKGEDQQELSTNECRKLEAEGESKGKWSGTCYCNERHRSAKLDGSHHLGTDGAIRSHLSLLSAAIDCQPDH